MIIEVIPYSSFKEKISIVKKYKGQADIEIEDDYVCIMKYGKVENN